MKKDMFYNYDYNIDKKEYPYTEAVNNHNKLEGYSGQWLVYDYKGNEIGLRAYKGAPIELFFNFSGTVDDSYDIETFLNAGTIYLQIVDCFHNVLIERNSVGEVINNSIIFKIIDKDDKLKKDTYYINLYIQSSEGEIYNLYNEKDGFLSII